MSDRVRSRIELPDNAGSVTLYDPDSAEFKDGKNLVRTGPDGAIVWKASPLDAGIREGQGDCFVAMQWEGQTLTANSWSCHYVSVDIDDGRVTILAFTK